MFLTETQKFILRTIRNNNELTRYELHDLTDIPKSTLHENLVDLHSAELIEGKKVITKKKGRPAIIFSITEKGKYEVFDELIEQKLKEYENNE